MTDIYTVKVLMRWPVIDKYTVKVLIDVREACMCKHTHAHTQTDIDS